jgi:ribose transport system substrate-binding protein
LKKRLLVSLVCSIFFIALIGFILKEDDNPTVVIVLKRFDSEYWRIFASGAERAFDEFNVNGEVIAPNSIYPATLQLNLLENVLNQNSPDALIVAPTHPDRVIPILKKYKEQNIPVVITDTDVKWEDKITYIGTDNLELGEKAGALLASSLYPGEKVAIISGFLSEKITNQRITGAKISLETAGIKIVSEQQGYDNDGKIKPVMEDILQTYPDIKGIVATNDQLASAALKVIEKKGLIIPVIGVDGTTDMLEKIEKGKLDAMVAQNPYDMGYLSVENALNAINGETVNKRIDSGIDIITIDNAKDRFDFITKALQKREGVFK